MTTFGYGEPERHSQCPDEDSRCQHGDDMNCPALGQCNICNNSGYVLVKLGNDGTHAPENSETKRWKCNCDGTITEIEKTYLVEKDGVFLPSYSHRGR